MEKSAFDLGNQNSDIDSKIVASLERVSHAFRVLLWNESKTFSLTPMQVQVLIFLLYHSDEKRKVSYLANEFDVTKATISITVRMLEQKQLIKKTFEPHDTRSYIIHLTPKGKAVAEKTASFATQIQVPVSKMHMDDKTNLLTSLLGIIGHLNQTGVITIQRMCSTCTYYRNENKTHYCTLLKSKLKNTELRIDCPEHEPA